MRLGSALIAAAAAVALVIFVLLIDQFRTTGLIGFDWGHVGKLPTEIMVLLGAGAVIVAGSLMNRATRA